MRACYALLLLAKFLSLAAAGAGAVGAAAAPPEQQQLWQTNLLCRGSDRRLSVCPPSVHQALQERYAAALATSRSWPALIVSSAGGGSSSSRPRKGPAGDGGSGGGSSSASRFVVLARLLQPQEANIQWAQAFCHSLGGQLAHWRTEQEYSALAAAVRAAAAELRVPDLHMYVGAVQLPGMKRADAGWVWLHTPSQLPKQGFPWAPGEPNDHNQGAAQGSHTEDCAVLAAYHTGAALVDDFPCNYATPEGKFQFNGHNPHLTVACRSSV